MATQVSGPNIRISSRWAIGQPCTSSLTSSLTKTLHVPHSGGPQSLPLFINRRRERGRPRTGLGKEEEAATKTVSSRSTKLWGLPLFLPPLPQHVWVFSFLIVWSLPVDGSTLGKGSHSGPSWSSPGRDPAKRGPG